MACLPQNSVRSHFRLRSDFSVYLKMKKRALLNWIVYRMSCIYYTNSLFFPNTDPPIHARSPSPRFKNVSFVWNLWRHIQNYNATVPLRSRSRSSRPPSCSPGRIVAIPGRGWRRGGRRRPKNAEGLGGRTRCLAKVRSEPLFRSTSESFHVWLIDWLIWLVEFSLIGFHETFAR